MTIHHVINFMEALTSGEFMWNVTSVPFPHTISLTTCSDLGLQEDQSVEYGVRQCQEMASILHRLINDGKY